MCVCVWGGGDLTRPGLHGARFDPGFVVEGHVVSAWQGWYLGQGDQNLKINIASDDIQGPTAAARWCLGRDGEWPARKLST